MMTSSRGLTNWMMDAWAFVFSLTGRT